MKNVSCHSLLLRHGHEFAVLMTISSEKNQVTVTRWNNSEKCMVRKQTNQKKIHSLSCYKFQIFSVSFPHSLNCCDWCNLILRFFSLFSYMANQALTHFLHKELLCYALHSVWEKPEMIMAVTHISHGVNKMRPDKANMKLVTSYFLLCVNNHLHLNSCIAWLLYTANALCILLSFFLGFIIIV